MNSNQYAFPFKAETQPPEGNPLIYNAGMTKREFTAAFCLAALLANPAEELVGLSPEQAKNVAINHADGLWNAIERGELEG